MPIYDLDINPVAIEQLPPDKRYPSNIALITGLLAPLQWAHDLIFNSFYVGSSAPIYSPGAYNYLDQVIYNKQVYVSLIAANTDVPTTDNWELIQSNFIGIKERILYNGQKLVLEYALNKEFGTTFRQPPAQSDIYITNVAAIKSGFFVGDTEPNCSSVGLDTSSDWIGSLLPFIYLTNFQINIPAADLALTNVEAISDFVKLYIPASLIFTIQSY
jgi:hypothetical protein